MKLESLTGTIERRLLINYRVDPDVAANILPAPFRPAVVDGHAIAGICLIQLRVGPAWLPSRGRLRSANGAHRIAVTLPDGSDAVYVPRRDTNSRLNALAGGRVFPGTQHRASIQFRDDGDQLAVALASADGGTEVNVTASIADGLPSTSVFRDVQHVSDFFEQGSLGYSDTPKKARYDGLELRTTSWSVTPMTVGYAESTFFENRALFPPGSIELDNALLMRNIDHTWQARPALEAVGPSSYGATLEKTTHPLAPNMPPTPRQTEISAPST